MFFLGSPNDIPPNAKNYLNSLQQPSAALENGMLEFMDPSMGPVYLNPKFHFRPYNPVSPLALLALQEGQEDLRLFDENTVPVLGHILDAPLSLDEIIHYLLDSEWRVTFVSANTRKEDAWYPSTAIGSF
ncbi:hypothetical protein DFH09DRAFT_1309392 [Mycena vulgaris]|nr:hypothetical protein DFH09DRAFT_1309392 [Mycena vulgaris]